MVYSNWGDKMLGTLLLILTVILLIGVLLPSASVVVQPLLFVVCIGLILNLCTGRRYEK